MSDEVPQPIVRAAPRIALLIGAAAMLVALAAFESLARFNRAALDDFVYAATLRDYGFLGAQRYWYSVWSGRVAYTFAALAAQSFGLSSARVVPPLVYSVWLATSVWLFRVVCRRLETTNPTLVSVAASAAVIVTAAASSETRGFVLWWQTAVLTYPAGIALAMASVAALLSRRSGVARICAPLLAFVACGFSETVATALIIGIVALLVSRRLGDPLGVDVKGAGISLAAAILMFLIVVAAPGNFGRLATEGSRPAFAQLLLLTASSPFSRAVSLIVNCWSGVLLSGAIGILAGTTAVVRRRRSMVILVFVACIGTTVCCELPALAAYGRPLPPRASLVIDVVWLGGIFLASSGIRLKGRHREALSMAAGLVVVVVSLVSAISATRFVSAETPRATRLARAWERQDEDFRALRMRGVKDVTTGYYIFWDYVDRNGPEATNPGSVHNRPIALYYGFRSVRGR